MEKTYITPELEIVELNTRYQLMAGSEIGAREEEPEEYGAPSFNF